MLSVLSIYFKIMVKHLLSNDIGFATGILDDIIILLLKPAAQAQVRKNEVFVH